MYYRTFAAQFISFLERDEELIGKPLLSLQEIRDYGREKSIALLVSDVNELLENEKMKRHDLTWLTASHAPHRYAAVLKIRFLVILDEFQNITQYVYRDEKCEGSPDETMAGSFHSLVESKVAPMLVTGSYVRWLIDISGRYLEAGRLSEWYMEPYLTEDEGLEAISVKLSTTSP